MKRFSILVAVLSMFIATSAFAETMTLAWSGHKLATGYRIEMTMDVTSPTPVWTVLVDNIPQPDPFPVDETIQAEVDIPETGLVLLRAVAFDNTHDAIRTETGLWFNALWASMAPQEMREKK